MTEPAPVLLGAAGPIATITINRPDRRNAINPAVAEGIATALARAEDDDDIKAVVLTGAGDRAFCAGGDLGGMNPGGPLHQHHLRMALGSLFTSLRSSRLPIVARVNGQALGGGFGLMLACDVVVASAEAQMGMPEVDIGLWPFMITAVVQRDLPRKVSLEMMLSARRLDAEEAARWGIVNQVAPPAELDAAVGQVCDSLASKSSLVLSLGKRSFYAAEAMDFEPALQYLAGMLGLCLQSADAAEGISAFMQKRRPDWKGR